METTINAINWFEIPVADFERAKKFYGSILSSDLYETEMNGIKMGFLPATNNGVGGSICKSDNHQPSTSGTCVFINGQSDLNNVLSKVEGAGGQIVMPKTNIGNEAGNIAYFIDSEGNKVGLHSMS